MEHEEGGRTGATRPFASRGGAARRGGARSFQGQYHAGHYGARQASHGPIELQAAGPADARKTAMLGRWRADLALGPEHGELLAVLGGDAETLEALAAIWRPQLPSVPAPVSMRPIDGDEQAVLATGQLSGQDHHRAQGGGAHQQQASQPRAQRPPHKEDQSEEEEVLWATPGEDAAIGAFDANGMFVIPGGPAPQSIELWDRPQREPVAQPVSNEPVEEDEPPGIAAPLVSAATKWVYMDSEGNAQGPFACAKMHAWHARGYFVDGLLLRREEDTVYAPLSEWRRRLNVPAGSSPFEPAVGTNASGTSPVLSPIALARPAPIQPVVQPAPIQQAPIQPVAQQSPPVVQIGQVPLQTRPVSDEQHRFLLQLGLSGSKPEPKSVETAVPKAMDDEQLRFFASLQTGAKSSEPASQPLALDADQLSFLRQVGLSTESKQSPNAVSDGVSKLEIGQSKPVKSESKKSESRTEAKTLESAKTQESRQEPVKTTEPEIRPAPAPSVGWSKAGKTAQQQSLAEILAEEEARAAADRRQRDARANVAPKSFADTLRLAEAARAVPAVKPVAAQTAAPVRPAIAPTSPKAHVLSTPAITTPKDARTWCMEQLRALDGLFDVSMCTLLLMELRTPADVRAFVDDNIRGPAAARAFDADAFVAGLVARRFETPATSASTDTNRAPAADFQTAGRRAKPSRK